MKRLLFFLCLVLCILTPLRRYLLERSQASVLTKDVALSPAFRKQQVSPEVFWALKRKSGGDGEAFARELTEVMLDGRFTAVSERLLNTEKDYSLYERYRPDAYADLLAAYEAIWADVQYFPVAAETVCYEESWGARRTYGGERLHEGCDVFGEQDVSGLYPIVSMTEGVVEQVGWLPLGGYRIGIRSPHGGYFYYAHLSSYDRDYVIGEQIAAGEILGFMGSTGYGATGTFGRFPVHLHLGIYIAAAGEKEVSVNPYWVLRALEEQKVPFGKENEKAYAKAG